MLDVCVVLPSKRAATYLRKELHAQAEQTIWLPMSFTMQDLFAHFSNFELLDRTEALCLLYNSYLRCKGDKANNFGEFLAWGPTLLRDFNDVDNYLLDPIPFFTNLRHIKEVEQWSLSMEELSPEQLNFTKLWEEQGKIYNAFKLECERLRKATYGGMGREIAQNIDCVLADDRISDFHFVGLNALSKSERLLLRKLVEAEKAQCHWDADPHYLDNEVHEAGHSLRTVKKEIPTKVFQYSEAHFAATPKEVRTIPATDNLEQVRIVCAVLEGLEPEDQRNTVVVLPDQQLLLPLLMAMPENVPSFNITMGVALRGSPAMELLEALISLQESRSTNQGQRYYHKDLKKVLNHPLLLKALPGFKAPKLNGAYQAPLETLVGEVPANTQPLQSFLQGGCTVHEVLDNIMALLVTLQHSSTLHVVELEFLKQAALLWKQLLELQSQHELITDLRTIQRMMRHLASEHDVTFIGEPLQGLQIMGVLETRALDFNNVIFLSMNEGIMPEEDHKHSFIPYDLRLVYGLPDRKDRASVQAYNFYRSIQRAKRVHFTYSTGGNEMGGGGASRFLAQMKMELAQLDNVTFTTGQLVSGAVSFDPLTLQVPKTEALLEKLRAVLEKGLSPSAMAAFLNCPLDFYYKYVLGIRDPEETIEHLDNASLGTVVHNASEALTKPLLHNILKPELLVATKQQITQEVQKAILAIHPKANLDQGQDLLHFEMAQQFVRTYLDREAIRCEKEEIVITALEKELAYILQTNINGQPMEIRLYGKADRVDRSGNCFTLIDLKSGRLQNNDLKIGDVEEILSKPQLRVLQLLTYGFMLLKNEEDAVDLRAGIFPFANARMGLRLCQFEGTSLLPPSLFDLFEQQLLQLVRMIMDPSTPFQHNPDAKFCSFCQNGKKR